MKTEPEYLSTTIVLVGDFNPAIFQPAWFAANELISQTEADNAEIQVIHPDVSSFHADWLRIRVEKNRFVAETSEQPYIRLHDLVVRTFGDYLSQTPIKEVGINFSVHIHMSGVDSHNRIGRTLAPVEPWGAMGDLMKKFPPGDRQHGGLKVLKMQIPREDNDYEGARFVTVEPSNRVKNGVYIMTNDHYSLAEDTKGLGCEDILGIVKEVFDPSLNYSETVVDHIIGLGTEP